MAETPRKIYSQRERKAKPFFDEKEKDGVLKTQIKTNTNVNKCKHIRKNKHTCKYCPNMTFKLFSQLEEHSKVCPSKRKEENEKESFFKRQSPPNKKPTYESTDKVALPDSQDANNNVNEAQLDSTIEYGEGNACSLINERESPLQQPPVTTPTYAQKVSQGVSPQPKENTQNYGDKIPANPSQVVPENSKPREEKERSQNPVSPTTKTTPSHPPLTIPSTQQEESIEIQTQMQTENSKSAASRGKAGQTAAVGKKSKKKMQPKMTQNKQSTNVQQQNPAIVVEQPAQPTGMESVQPGEVTDQLDDDAKSISEAYNEIVKWRRNLFDLPKGNIGKKFVDEMTKQIKIGAQTAMKTHSSV